MEVPDIVQMEKETNQDRKGALSRNNYLGNPSMRSCHEDKRNNQVTTTTEKEDDADSTATVTTAALRGHGAGGESLERDESVRAGGLR